VFTIQKETNKQNRDKLLSSYRASGQTQAGWCAANDVKVKTLQYWLRREREQAKDSDTSASWVALNVKGDLAPSAMTGLVVHAGAFRIELNQQSDLALFQHVMQSLRYL